MELDVVWIPREQNIEADELSNGVFRSFSAKNNIPIDLAAIKFEVLDDLMAEAGRFYGDLTKKKETPKADAAALADRPLVSVARKKRSDERLRARDPW